MTMRLSGSWTIHDRMPALSEIEAQIGSGTRTTRLALDGSAITEWDSGFVTFMLKLEKSCEERGIVFDLARLPQGVQRLLNLAMAVPERAGARRTAESKPFLTRFGEKVITANKATRDMVAFLGEATLAFGRYFAGKARFRRSDFYVIIQQCGADAFPIVSLISFLVGLILAYIGAVQLRTFGATIYVADLVGLAMVREMGAMMTAIIMAGRTGAAFAAQLGTMQVNEEIDALRTMGIVPMDFLVLPRMLALVLMMPLLCLYANLMGILGGTFVAVAVLDIGLLQFFVKMQGAIDLVDCATGLLKGAIYGVIVAIAGCLRGMECGRSASAVGAAATSAVVTAIVIIICASAVLTIIYDILGV